MSRDTFEKLPPEKKEKILSAGIRMFSEKAYPDVSTESITKTCGISKGILFHYFGSKKKFYLYCLEKAMDRLTRKEEDAGGEDFCGILFSEMNRKMALCREYRDETHLVNMAARDGSAEIAAEKAELLGKYAAGIRAESARTIRRALAALTLRDESGRRTAEEGMLIYTNAVLNRYLLQYRQDPDRFFEDAEKIREEMKEYLDLMLYGICEQERT